MTIVHMTREEALNIWAAERWLASYEAWGIGVEETDFTIRKAREYLTDMVRDLKDQTGAEEKTMVVTTRGRRILESVEMHLDRYAIARTFKDRPRTPMRRGRK